MLGDTNAEQKSLLYGGIVLLLLIGILPFLPEHLPNMAILIATILTTRIIVEKNQFTKQAIAESEVLRFHSNWRVLWIGLLCMIVFLAVALAVILALEPPGCLISADSLRVNRPPAATTAAGSVSAARCANCGRWESSEQVYSPSDRRLLSRSATIRTRHSLPSAT